MSDMIYGLIGKNISYSLSPVMHNAAFRYFGIPAEYRLFDMDEASLSVFLVGMLSDTLISGVNVTVPYKIKAMDVIARSVKGGVVDDGALASNAVNTVVREKGSLKGYNTDGRGFMESLADDAGFSPRGKKVFLSGAGGAGNTICAHLASLKSEKPEVIFVWDVDNEKKCGLVRACNERYGAGSSVTVNKDDIVQKLEVSDLVVNATPLGTKAGDPLPFPVERVKAGSIVYDLVYSRKTEVVKIARGRGANALDGSGMLANQGAVAFSLWTGKPLKEVKTVMKKALLDALSSRSEG
ncbi:MAG: shikimate dehydrogenase [Candidatus Omnitrophica bacterium]|nr:shikimate dehydrogenase [Candidatus Omnitrophota bacterium]